jgi:hypothetical protein
MQHPEITWAERTGYPSWNQPQDVRCDYCGEVIEDDVYADEFYEFLCLDCLLKLHLKDMVEQ